MTLVYGRLVFFMKDTSGSENRRQILRTEGVRSDHRHLILILHLHKH